MDDFDRKDFNTVKSTLHSTSHKVDQLLVETEFMEKHIFELEKNIAKCVIFNVIFNSIILIVFSFLYR